MVDQKVCESKTDEQLVTLSIKSQGYYAFLMERYEAKILRYIIRISSMSKEEAEDILQEVFISVYQNLNDFDTDLKFSSWIYRIAHNKTRSHYRKIKARPQTVTYEKETGILPIPDLTENIFEAADRKMTAGEVRKIIDELDNKYREVLVLKFLEGLDYKEISDVLKKPMGTVATLINRAKKQFREKALNNKILDQ